MAAAVALPPAELHRNRPGIRQEAWSQWPITPIDQVESTFPAQEYIQNLIRKDPADLKKIVEVPAGQDRDVWQYEHLRQICLQLNSLVVLLEPECTVESCPEMKAHEWLYLCAGHPSPQGCPALDYIVHTLDSATALLNSQKSFSSRISIPQSSLKHFANITRRLHRIFAHTWFHHRAIFQEFEVETHLYGRSYYLIKYFDVMPDDAVIVPVEACMADIPYTDTITTEDGDGDDQPGRTVL
ncbi:Mob1/phocein [Fimicolochytrium jonesii]|uniref:Mob1/phocein n=1 Tax=Fimicolochytrium jonesii TaxID=1396493 RepID=UPI0022FDC3C8|nr:Mob1/phocein [Fimicolochytrium jonesii]KAI8816401.1 Mob1/phocein [Fimicolochytrium jonesii]